MKQDGQIDTDANDAPESGFNLSRVGHCNTKR